MLQNDGTAFSIPLYAFFFFFRRCLFNRGTTSRDYGWVITRVDGISTVVIWNRAGAMVFLLLVVGQGVHTLTVGGVESVGIA